MKVSSLHGMLQVEDSGISINFHKEKSFEAIFLDL